MSVLENVGIGILFVLILAFVVFFAMLGVMFIFGLPQLYVHFLSKIGKRIEGRFPTLYKSKNFQGFIVIFLIVTVSLIVVGAIFVWFGLFGLLPD